MLGKKRTKPTTEDELLAQAFEDVRKHEEKKEKRRRRGIPRLLPQWLDARIIWGLLIVIVVIIADGVRRENQEFRATVISMVGQAQMLTQRGGQRQMLTAGATLEDNNVVVTGPRSQVVLDFPDGSVITIGENADFTIKLLEYNRGGRWRARSFFVAAGQVWARISPNFGAKSELKLYTPASVAAVRGTTFSVYAVPGGQQSEVMCAQGYVDVRGWTGQTVGVPQFGGTVVNAGMPPPPPRPLPPAAQYSFSREELMKPIPPELWLKTFELTVTQTLSAPLDILGIGKASWAVGAADFARRTATAEGLRQLRLFIEGFTSYPEYVNPATLEELTIDPENVMQILEQLNGRALESYQQTGGGRGFVIYARARDKKRTLYMIDPTGVQRIKEQQ